MYKLLAMKAYKQMNLKKEQRALWSYFTILSLVSFGILFSPVFAQQDESIETKPQINLDVQKAYDEEGNLNRLDSSWSWSWNWKELNRNHDSIWNKFHDHYKRTTNDINSQKFFDSSFMSFLNDSIKQNLINGFHWPSPNYWNELSFTNSQNWEYIFDMKNVVPDKENLESLVNRQKKFNQRFKEYHKAHRKLLEKYFYEFQNEDLDSEIQPKSRPKPNNSDKLKQI